VTALQPDARVLYMSGYAHAVLGAGTLAREISLVEKPFSEQMLLTKVREVLDGEPSVA
jgi:hypothetical protein